MRIGMVCPYSFDVPGGVQSHVLQLAEVMRGQALTLWGMNENMMPDSGIMKLAKGLRNGRMVLVPNCGHWVMMEHRELFNRMVLDFLKNG